MDHADTAVAFVHADFFDIAVGGVDAAGQQGDQATLVLQLDSQFDIELTGDVLGPGKLHAFFRVVADFTDVAAVLQVHDHAFARRQVADDRVTRDRGAALGIAEHQAFGAADGQRAFRCGQLLAFGGQQATGHDVGHAIAQADVFEQILEQLQAVLAENRLDALRRNLLQAAVEAGEDLVQQAFTQADRLGPALLLECMANMRARLAGDHEVEPCGVRTGTRRADDFHRRAALQRFGQRRQAAIDTAGDATVADVGVHRVSEVDGGGAFGQLHDPALGREDVDLVREEVDLDAFDELQGVAGTLLQLEDALDPLAGAGMVALGLFILVGLVQPVRSDPVVGHLFHFAGADLDLDGYAMHAEQRRMQGLVAVGLGNRDVVLEATGQWLVQVVYGAEHAVAGVDLVDDDAEGIHVHDLVEGAALAAHLLVDAIEVFLPAADLAFDAIRSQAVGQRLLDLGDDLLAVATGALDRAVDQRGAHRVHRLEAEVFELHTHVVHAQPVGDGGVDLEGFLGDAPAFFAREHFQGAHVVQAVGQFDQDHADVAGHGHGHLLEVFGLGFGLGLEVHLGQLADPVDQLGDSLAELLAEGFLGDAGVFDHIVQHSGHQALMVHVHVGQDAGHGQRVGHVGLAATAALTIVRLFGVEIGPADQIDLVGAEVGRQPFGEGFYTRHGFTSGRGRRPCAARCRPGMDQTASLFSSSNAAKTGSSVTISSAAMNSGVTIPSAISRRATTVGLSFSHATRGSLPPVAS